MSNRTLHFGLNALPAGNHPGSWRSQQASPFSYYDFKQWQYLAKVAERGTLDAIFLADSPSLQTPPASGPSIGFDPTVLLGALASVTEYIGLVGTGTPSQNTTTSQPTSQPVSQSTKTALLKVGSRNNVTEDVLKFVQKELAPSHGLEFQIVTIGDSVKINDALKNKEIDANLFQHELFMKQAAKRLKADFVMLNRSYTTVFALYSKRLKIKSVNEIPVGATVGISNDDSNQDRALKFLKHIGLINLKEKSGEYFTVQDVIAHPKNLKIKELDNYALARGLDDLDLAVAYSSFLLQAKIDLKPIALDDIGIADKKYATGLATLPEKANDPNIQKLNQLIVDPKLKDFINTNYKGTVVPSF